MKKSFITISMVAIALIVSCKKSSVKEQNNQADSDMLSVSAIDPETPKGIQPYIINTGTTKNGASTSAAPSGYTLVWSDEFNSGTLNTGKWTKTVSPTSRDPRPSKGITDWFFKADQVSVNDTKLILKATKHDSNTMYCGSVDSKNKYQPKYGYIEVLVDNADISKAVHTAFWLQGANQAVVDESGYDGCEVDVFESAFTNGKHTQTALHWDGYGTSAQAWTKHWNNAGTGDYAADIHTGYHIIGLEWTSTSLAVYYDGVKMFTYSGVGVPRVSEWLLLSVGASFGDGDFTSRQSGYLTEARYDWIRVYSKN